MPLLTFESPCRKLMSDALLLLLLLVLEMKRSWLKVHHAYNMCVLGKYNVHKERCALLDKWKNHIFYICFRQEVVLSMSIEFADTYYQKALMGFDRLEIWFYALWQDSLMFMLLFTVFSIIWKKIPAKIYPLNGIIT